VQYPLRFDVLPFTDIELKATLANVRAKVKEEHDKELGLVDDKKEDKDKEKEKDKEKRKK